MNEDNQINYYSIIPATVRYDKNLKAQEKLLYSEITCLSNKYGYCYAKNSYFANLYNVSNRTVSRWFSNLQKLGYINMELITNENKEITKRLIYILDNPPSRKLKYPIEKNFNTLTTNLSIPYTQNCLPPMDKNDQYNNINNNNIKINNINIKNKDDLFFLIINNKKAISKEFYKIIERFEFNYNNKMLEYLPSNIIEELKIIIYVLYDLFNSDFNYIIPLLDRASLLSLYNISVEHNPEDLVNYYRRAIINKYANKGAG